MAAVDSKATCAPSMEAYEKIGLTEKQSSTKAACRRWTFGRRTRDAHVGTWAKPGEAPIIGPQETSTFMITISKFPGMNAMAVLHDHLSYS
jgi:hypothetical protein